MRARGTMALGVWLALAACGADEGSSTGGRSSGPGGGGSADPFGNSTPGTGDGNFGNTNTMGGPVAGGAADPGSSKQCANIEVDVTRKKPVVMIVVDGSGSMSETFGGGTRWTELQKALIDPTVGVVPQLESAVEFGLSIYQSADLGMCPALTQVPTALMNAMPITTSYQTIMPNGGTPTGEALQAVVDMMPDVSMMPDADPHVIILATDGMPNGCGGLPANVTAMCPNVPSPIPLFPPGPDPFCVAMALANAPPDTQSTLDATKAAMTKGVQTYVISLAPGLVQMGELQKVANLGLGMAETATPGAPIFEPTNPDALRDALLMIIGGAVGCTIEVQGTLAFDRACEGTVTLNGVERECGGADGWRPVDETHFELVGAACMEFQANPTVSLSANWPCGVIVPL